MATKADFTEEEWKALQKGVTGSGMLVSAQRPRLHRHLRRTRPRNGAIRRRSATRRG